MHNIERDDDEIDELLNDICDQKDLGGSRFPGMSYEDGMEAALRWLFGEWEDHPYPER